MTTVTVTRPTRKYLLMQSKADLVLLILESLEATEKHEAEMCTLCEQIEAERFENQAGYLKNFIPFLRLKELVDCSAKED